MKILSIDMYLTNRILTYNKYSINHKSVYYNKFKKTPNRFI